MLLPAGVNASPRMELAEKKDPESNFDTFSNVVFHFSSLRLYIFYAIFSDVLWLNSINRARSRLSVIGLFEARKLGYSLKGLLFQRVLISIYFYLLYVCRIDVSLGCDTTWPTFLRYNMRKRNLHFEVRIPPH